MRRILAAIVVALSLAGCTTTGTTVGQILTGTLPNPVSTTNIYELKNVYAIAAQSAVDWRSYCFARSYAALMADPIAQPICTGRRARVRAIQGYKNKAFSAVTAAGNFVRNNPTLDATALISAGWSATAALQSATPAIPK